MIKHAKQLCTIVLFLVLGCGNEPEFNGAQTPEGSNGRTTDEIGSLITQTFSGGVEENFKPVDISFIVDTSLSMREEKQQLQIHMASFITTLLARNLDYQVFMIGDNFNFPEAVSFNPKFMRVTETVDSYNGLQVGLRYLTGDFNARLEKREDALQYMIYISDDESSMSANVFKQTVTTMGLKNISINGLVGLTEGGNTANCNVDNVGNAYIDLAQMDEFKGLIGDVCSNDWASLIEMLAKSVLTQVAISEFKLEQIPVLGSQFAVEVDGEFVSKDQYVYNEEKNAIVFKPEHAPQNGSSVTIKYYIDN